MIFAGIFLSTWKSQQPVTNFYKILTTEGLKTFYFITILRTDISSSRTKPAGHSGSEGTDSLRKESDQTLATL